MAKFVSQETVARLSGILPSQTTRSQVAKFKLDHHKMIYKEKRRMSMPGKRERDISKLLIALIFNAFCQFLQNSSTNLDLDDSVVKQFLICHNGEISLGLN